MDYVTTDRATLYGQATSKLAAYGRAWLAAPDTGELPCVVGDILDLSYGVGELRQLPSPEAGSQEEARAALIVGHLVRRHGLGALPIAASTPIAYASTSGTGSIWWNQINGIPGNLAFLPIDPADVQGLTVYIQNVVNAMDLGGGSSHDSLTDVQVLVKPGTTASGQPLHLDGVVGTDLLAMLYPFVQPTATVTISPTALQELGTTTTVTVDGGFAVGSDSAPTQGVYKVNGTTHTTQTSGIGSAISVTGVAETTTFQFTATFPTSGLKVSSILTLTFAPPAFFGCALPGASTATVLGLSKNVSVHGSSLSLAFPAGTIGQVYHFAFPNAWGHPVQVKDGSGFDVTAAWTAFTTATYTNGPYSATYRFLKSANPFVGSTSGETLTFFW